MATIMNTHYYDYNLKEKYELLDRIEHRICKSKELSGRFVQGLSDNPLR